MDTTVHTITMEELTEGLIATNMMGNATSQGIPDLIYQVSCDNEAHKVTSDMTKGFFSISGMEFIRKSCAQVNDISEMRIKTKGCGYEGRESTLEDALWQFSGPILCYQCRGTHNTVDMIEGCGQHTDTKLTTLIFNGLAFVAKLYYKE